MNTKRSLIFLMVLIAAVLLGSSLVSAQGNSGNGNGNGNGSGQGSPTPERRGPGGPRGNVTGGRAHLHLPAASADELPQDIIDLMIEGWVDEQHAYAVYGSVIEQFGAVRPFTNIQRSEAQHIAAWETLFVRYGIVPEVPEFDLPEFASVAEACAIGAEAEIANFSLYDAMLTAFEPYPDLLYVAQSLRDASEFNHLPAFEACAAR